MSEKLTNSQRLNSYNRCDSQKQKGSNNREKARLKVARIDAVIADTQRDFTYKYTGGCEVRHYQLALLGELNRDYQICRFEL